MVESDLQEVDRSVILGSLLREAGPANETALDLR
jgi:hypothetical protein